MTLNDLARAVAAKQGITIAHAEETLTVALNEIKDELKGLGKVSLHGFGIFEPTAKAATTARNPATGGKVDVPAKTVVKFKPAAGLKTYLNS